MTLAEYFCVYALRSVLIIADLLTSKLLNVYELDPARRHLPSYHRGSQRYTQTRYSAFEKGAGDVSRVKFRSCPVHVPLNWDLDICNSPYLLKVPV